MNKYLALDWETGGITLDATILTGFFGVFDENFALVDELLLNVKPDDGVYRVTARAMEVNRINLVEHDKIAIPNKAAKPVLYEFIKKNTPQGGKLTPVGHGVKIDIDWTKHNLISEGSWETYISYRTLCTSNAVQFLRAGGRFPDEVSGSLGSLVEHFKLPSVGELHNCRVDTLQTVLVLQELLKIIKI